jgi:chemotaxis protein histidine kinase CheA
MRFNNVSQLSHKIEDLLIEIQDEQILLSEDSIELLFRSTDLISQYIEAILQGNEHAIDMTEMGAILDRAANGEEISTMLAQLQLNAKKQNNSLDKTSSEFIAEPSPSRSQEPDTPPQVKESIRVDVDRLDNAVRLVGEIAVSHRKSERTLLTLQELQRFSRHYLKQLRQFFHDDKRPGVDKNLEKELLKKSEQLLKGIENTFKDNKDEMAMRDIAIAELHEDVLKMRMLPLSVVFDTFPRAVRDMAKYFQKHIELRITGEETTIDKKIIEKLNGPLIHILRNAIDHGIETPQERLAQGKPTNGLVTIDAYPRSGHIRIEISDDGRGIQLEKLKQHAIQRNLISEEKIRTLDETELINLVFIPRLSTSEMITDISGRGVGMDIVKANIEHLKGAVSLRSRPNKGTSCFLTLPMTLTTIRSLIISSQQKLFALPINSIEETLQIPAQEFIQVVGHNAIRLRNQIIYVVDLADVLGLKKANPAWQEQHFVLIARANEKLVGLIVDEVLDEQDVVVKQLPAHMQHIKTIAGATISSDNAIILILHIPEIIEVIKQVTIDAKKNPQEHPTPPRILVVDDSINTGEIEKRILQAYGYQVDLAHDGIEALEHVENETYNLIVTDIEMPGMDGFTLTERLRGMSAYADVPIVIVTSLEREADKKRGRRVGANAYIMKGNFEQRSLIETVRSLV